MLSYFTSSFGDKSLEHITFDYTSDQKAIETLVVPKLDTKLYKSIRIDTRHGDSVVERVKTKLINENLKDWYDTLNYSLVRVCSRPSQTSRFLDHHFVRLYFKGPITFYVQAEYLTRSRIRTTISQDVEHLMVDQHGVPIDFKILYSKNESSTLKEFLERSQVFLDDGEFSWSGRNCRYYAAHMAPENSQ